MSNTDALRGLLGTIEKTADVVCKAFDASDNVFNTTLRFLDKVEKVVEGLIDEEPESPAPVYTESVELFDTGPSREEKIKVVRDYLYKAGFRDGVWFGDTDAYPDSAVDKSYKFVMDKAEYAKKAKADLNRAVDGDRFNIFF